MSDTVVTQQGMSARTAATVENTIIGIALLSLLLIFQPFSLALYSVGCGLAVFAALAFNLVPLCEKGRPARSLVTAGIIVLVLLFVIVGLAILSAWLYGVYFVQRP
jgi:hypothetical protein